MSTLRTSILIAIFALGVNAEPAAQGKISRQQATQGSQTALAADLRNASEERRVAAAAQVLIVSKAERSHEVILASISELNRKNAEAGELNRRGGRQPGDAVSPTDSRNYIGDLVKIVAESRREEGIPALAAAIAYGAAKPAQDALAAFGPTALEAVIKQVNDNDGYADACVGLLLTLTRMVRANPQLAEPPYRQRIALGIAPFLTGKRFAPVVTLTMDLAYSIDDDQLKSIIKSIADKGPKSVGLVLPNADYESRVREAARRLQVRTPIRSVR